MLRSIFLIFILLLSYSNSYAATINAASCSSAHINTAISSAATGDTVVVPSGSCTWTSHVTIPASKAITLQGAGIGQTNITAGGNAIIIYTVPGAPQTRVTGFSITYSANNGGLGVIRINPDEQNGSNTWRIDHIDFTYTGSDYADRTINVWAHTFGVIDNCKFHACPGPVMVQSSSQYDNYYGDYSWTLKPDVGMPSGGGYPAAVYVEDCEMDQMMFAAGDQAIESRMGARYVFRFNTVKSLSATTHTGVQMGGWGSRNPHHAELYHNTFIHDQPESYKGRAINIRDTGTGMIFNNTVTGYDTLGMIAGELFCKGDSGGPYDDGPFTSYPAPDQVGRIGPNAYPNQTFAPWYIWGNYVDGSYTGIVYNYADGYYCAATTSMMQSDRDFVNMAATKIGTSLPGTCTQNDGYFKTNEGALGVLYRCESTNTWVKYYEPYTYPHPLRSDVPIEDTFPPVFTYDNLNGLNVACTDQVTLIKKTNENAVCRISTTNQTWDQMGSSKQMENTEGTTHSQVITGLTCPGSGSTAYTRYVVCQDLSPAHNTQTSATATTWNILAAGGSPDEPKISNQFPTTDQPCTSGSESINIGLSTDRDATCKWSYTDQAYASMENTYTTPQTSPLVRNGRWLYYNNRPIRLQGYDYHSFFSTKTESVNDVKAKLDTMASYGITAIRVFLNPWNLSFYAPYTQSGGKWNLGTWDTDFFTRWKELIAYAKTKGIMVEIAIFSEYPCVNDTGCNFNFWNDTEEYPEWSQHYWRSASNNQGYFSDVSGDFYPQFFTLNYTESGHNLTTIQLALIDKVIAEFNSIGNVLFLIHNEHPTRANDPPDGTYIDQIYQWQQYMADYMRTKGAIVAVHAQEFTGQHWEGIEYWKTRDSIDVLCAHPYTETIDEFGDHWSPRQSDGKILYNDETRPFVDDDGSENEHTDNVRREIFASFVNGVYVNVYHAENLPLDSNWQARSEAFKITKNISDQVAWWEMSRNPSLVTAGPADYWQGIAKAGEYYVFYFAINKSSTAASLYLPAGTYNYKWYSGVVWDADGIASGQVVSTGATKTITAPSTGDWDSDYGVFLVIIKDGLSPASQSTTHIDTATGLSCGQQVKIYSRCTDGTYTNSTSALTSFWIASLTPPSKYEAEAGTLAGTMAETSDTNASGGAYISSSASSGDPANSNTATFTVNLSGAGSTKNYRIVLATWAADDGSDSMFLEIDSSGTVYTLGFNPTFDQAKYNTWVVAPAAAANPSGGWTNPLIVSLTAASHTFVFKAREAGARLDYFYLMEEGQVPVPPEITGAMIVGSAFDASSLLVSASFDAGTLIVE